MCRWHCHYYLTVSNVLCDVQVALSILTANEVLCDLQVVVCVGIIPDNGKTRENEIVRDT